MILDLVLIAPIPVGHRVRVTWYQEQSRGLGGQTRTDERPHQPVVEDIDSGVVYKTDWAFGSGGRSAPDVPNDVGDRPLAHFEIEREVEGIVEACAVVTVRASSSTDVQTRIVLATGDGA